MKELNKLRLLSGIPIDVSIEKTEKKEVVTEARNVPRKSERAPKDEKSLMKGVVGLKVAIKHINLGIKALEKIPATNYMGDVPEFINQLEEVVSGGGDGLETYLKSCEDELRKFKRAEKKAQRETISEDCEDEDDEDEKDESKASKDDELSEELEEAMHFYANMNKDFEEDDEKPINVSDGSSNGEQVWDDPRDAKNQKDENPEQLRTSDEKSDQDQSDGADIEADMKIPASVKKSLADASAEAKAEAKKMSVNNKDAAYFYNDLAKAFDDLKGHLDKGTRYDFKLAQTFAQSLMGPMLHKLPNDVWKFLTNGGQTRSLKDYMKPVKDPITGPRNTIK